MAAARRPHGHRCAGCGDRFECPGPEVLGTCVPLCAPCYWLELGSQLRVYREIIEDITRKRRAMEQRVGKHACHLSELRRAKGRSAPLVVAFGNVMLQPGAIVEPASKARLRPRGGALS